MPIYVRMDHYYFVFFQKLINDALGLYNSQWIGRSEIDNMNMKCIRLHSFKCVWNDELTSVDKVIWTLQVITKTRHKRKARSARNSFTSLCKHDEMININNKLLL